MKTKLSNIAMVVAFVLVLAVVPVALAGKGGKGGGGTGGTTNPGAGTITSSCNPCAFQSTANFHATGLDGSNPRGMVAVTTSDGSTAWAGINVNPDGTSDFIWYMSPAGTYSFQVYQESHNRMTVMASLGGVVVQ